MTVRHPIPLTAAEATVYMAMEVTPAWLRKENAVAVKITHPSGKNWGPEPKFKNKGVLKHQWQRGESSYKDMVLDMFVEHHIDRQPFGGRLLVQSSEGDE